MTAGSALFLFDIDGTLLRAGNAVHRDAFAHAFWEVFGLPLDLNGISAAGRTDTWLLAEPLRRWGVAGEEIRAGMPRAFDLMGEYVEEHLGDLRDRVLPGVREVLGELDARGQVLGLLTGNLERIALAKMRHAGLDRYFDTGGFGEESEVRAHLVPVALEKTSQRLGHRLAPDQAVVIGDTPLDVEAGRTAGAQTAAVATGPFGVEALRASGADLVLPSLADAPAALEALLDLAASPRKGR